MTGSQPRSSVSILITVDISAGLEQVERAEADNPDVMAEIRTHARRYMTSHRRTHRDGHVMDIDEFATLADYHAFKAAARDAIARYGELVGGLPVDTIYETAPAG